MSLCCRKRMEVDGRSTKKKRNNKFRRRRATTKEYLISPHSFTASTKSSPFDVWLVRGKLVTGAVTSLKINVFKVTDWEAKVIWKRNTEYNGYRPPDKEIGWFWNIMFTLSLEVRKPRFFNLLQVVAKYLFLDSVNCRAWDEFKRLA